jgi:ribosomal-protein-alanine N-acetyltransferase
MQRPDRGAWPAAVPELTTPRLALRALQVDDAPALLEVLGDQRVTRHHSMPTLTSLPEARDALAGVGERFRAGEMIRWAIQPRTERLIGTIGLLHLVAEHRRGELGYELAHRWWGQGLMPEAAAAVIDYGFTALGLHRIEAGVLVGNRRRPQPPTGCRRRGFDPPPWPWGRPGGRVASLIRPALRYPLGRSPASPAWTGTSERAVPSSPARTRTPA